MPLASKWRYNRLSFSPPPRESMDKAQGVLIANDKVPRTRPVPRLKLLIPWESGRRVFFENLTDLLLSRRVPQVPISSRPAPFWNDVFVPSGAPWSSFMESLLCHLLLTVLFVWGQSRVWVTVELFPKRDVHRTITYYPPKPSFRASEGRASVRARAKQNAKQTPKTARQPALRVAPERKPTLVTPPDIKQATARLPDLPDARGARPMMPSPPKVASRQNTLAGLSGVVAPPPEVGQAIARRSTPLQAAAVSPAPELGGGSGGRALKTANTDGLRVVPPPPSVQSADNPAGAGRLRVLPGVGQTVVPPAPSVQAAGNGAGEARRGSLGGAGSQVVPPPPSVQGAGSAGGIARLSSLPATGPNVILPPPSVQGAGHGSGNEKLGSLAGPVPQVVQPPPSLQGSGGGAGTARLGSLSGPGPNVVPPPPTVQGDGNSANNAGLGSMAGTGSQVVPPPPAVQGSGSDSRVGALSGGGSDAVAPPTREIAGNGGGGGTGKILEPMDPLSTDTGSSMQAGNEENKVTIEELPLGLLGVVFAAPGTSFYSNFEVFVAKRKVGKDQMQLIKMVYEFLPYQRRLSEYNLNNITPRVIKLRVTPDPSCDESLGQMLYAHSDPASPATTEYPKLPAALRSSDMTAVLPCYRTTASDFQKAMSRSQ